MSDAEKKKNSCRYLLNYESTYNTENIIEHKLYLNFITQPNIVYKLVYAVSNRRLIHSATPSPWLTLVSLNSIVT